METELSLGRVRVFIQINDDAAEVDSQKLLQLMTKFHAKVTEQVVETETRKIGFCNDR